LSQHHRTAKLDPFELTIREIKRFSTPCRPHRRKFLLPPSNDLQASLAPYPTMPFRNVSMYLNDLERVDLLVTASNSNRPQLAWPHFQGPPDAATQEAAIFDTSMCARMYLFVNNGTIHGLTAPHLMPNNDVTFALGLRPSNMAQYKTTKDRFCAGIWSVSTKLSARTNGFPTTITPLADAKTAADQALALSDVDHYKNLGFEAYDGLAINDWSPVCTVVPVTMPLPPGCPAPQRLGPWRLGRGSGLH
jgi:hypothetical protein